jgi:hypothetical protein
MRIKDVKKGMGVRITGCKLTTETQGWCGDMRRFVGTTQIVDSVEYNPRHPRVKIKNWSWDHRDLEPLFKLNSKVSEIEKIQFFDEQGLWL